MKNKHLTLRKFTKEELDNNYITLDNRLDINNMKPIEAHYYREMIKKIEHVKELEDHDNIQILKDEIINSLLPNKYNKTIQYNKETIEKFAMKYLKDMKFDFSKYLESDKTTHYFVVSDDISLSKLYVQKKLNSYMEQKYLDISNFSEFVENIIKDIRFYISNNLSSLNNIFNDTIMITSVKSDYQFSFKDRFLNEFKLLNHGRVYIIGIYVKNDSFYKYI